MFCTLIILVGSISGFVSFALCISGGTFFSVPTIVRAKHCTSVISFRNTFQNWDERMPHSRKNLC
jgi:hypothetical protein